MNEWSLLSGNGGKKSWQVRVSLKEKTKMAESKIAKFKMAEFKMAAIIKLSQNEWVKFALCKWREKDLGKWEWVWKKKLRWLNPRWPNSRCQNSRWQCLNPTWQNSRWLPSTNWVRMNEWSFLMQMVGTTLGKCEWHWEEIPRWLNPRWPNSRWQN